MSVSAMGLFLLHLHFNLIDRIVLCYCYYICNGHTDAVGKMLQ